MNQKKIAIINDISSYGRCSTAVVLPIVSHLGIQGCPLPTALFSNHTGFESFFRFDFTDYMEKYMEQWKKLDLHFDGIMTGFLGSVHQIGIVEKFIKEFSSNATQIIVDPVMGDNGKLYNTYTKELQNSMKHLITYADIITPNLTEACFLTGTPYKPEGWKRSELEALCKSLHSMGGKKIVITGIRIGTHFVGNAIMKGDGTIVFQRQQIIERIRSGTGDVFASVLGADAINGIEFSKSVRRASGFVRQSLLASEQYNQAPTDGICFEEVLHKLKRQ